MMDEQQEGGGASATDGRMALPLTVTDRVVLVLVLVERESVGVAWHPIQQLRRDYIQNSEITANISECDATVDSGRPCHPLHH